jgi:hypothetical protein
MALVADRPASGDVVCEIAERGDVEITHVLPVTGR